MKTWKEGMQFLKETKDEGVSQAMLALYAPTKKQKTMMSMLVGSGALTAAIVPIFAGGQDLSNGIRSILNDIFKWIFGITTALAALLILISLIQYMISSSPQTGAQAKARILKIVIAWIAINSIGTIVSVVQDLSNKAGSGYNGTSMTN